MSYAETEKPGSVINMLGICFIGMNRLILAQLTSLLTTSGFLAHLCLRSQDSGRFLPLKIRALFSLGSVRIMGKGSSAFFHILFPNRLLCFWPCFLTESPKESSEPTGSPAPVIQHSSATAPSNGLSVRSAAEAVATSVLTQMASQRTELGMPIQSHVIMTPQSQSAGR